MNSSDCRSSCYVVKVFFFLGGGVLTSTMKLMLLKTIVFTFMIVDNVKLILDNEKDHTQNDLLCGEFPVTYLYSNVC